MSIAITKSKLLLILVIVFTVLVAIGAIGTAVLLQQNGTGGTKSKAATCSDSCHTQYDNQCAQTDAAHQQNLTAECTYWNQTHPVGDPQHRDCDAELAAVVAAHTQCTTALNSCINSCGGDTTQPSCVIDGNTWTKTAFCGQQRSDNWDATTKAAWCGSTNTCGCSNGTLSSNQAFCATSGQDPNCLAPNDVLHNNCSNLQKSIYCTQYGKTYDPNSNSCVANSTPVPTTTIPTANICVDRAYLSSGCICGYNADGTPNTGAGLPSNSICLIGSSSNTNTGGSSWLTPCVAGSGSTACACKTNACIGAKFVCGGTNGDQCIADNTLAWTDPNAPCRYKPSSNACKATDTEFKSGCNPETGKMCYCIGANGSTDANGYTYGTSVSTSSTLCGGCSCTGKTGLQRCDVCGNPYMCANGAAPTPIVTPTPTPVANIPCFVCGLSDNGLPMCKPSGTYRSDSSQSCPSGQDTDSACTNLNKCQPVSTPVPTTTVATSTRAPQSTPPVTTAPPVQGYYWGIKSYCDNKEVSGAAFSFTGDKGSSGTNQTTPRSQIYAQNGENINVACGGYFDATTGTMKSPTTANGSINSSNTQMSCNYTGCNIPVTTTPPPVPPAVYTCDSLTVSNGTTNLTRGDRVNTGDVLTINITGSSNTTGTGYSLNVLGGSGSMDSKQTNPGSFTYTVPQNGSDISIIGYATKPDNTKLFSAQCNFNLALNHVKGVESYIVSKVVDPISVVPGGTFNVTLRVVNSGNTPATIKELTDIIPDGFTYGNGETLTNADGTNGTISESTSGNNLVFTLNNGSGVSLNTNQALTVTFKLKAPTQDQCTTYTNVVMVSNPSGPSGQTNMTVCSQGKRLPNTGIFDTLITSVLIGVGMIAVAYATTKYDVAGRLNKLIIKRRR